MFKSISRQPGVTESATVAHAEFPLALHAIISNYAIFFRDFYFFDLKAKKSPQAKGFPLT